MKTTLIGALILAGIAVPVWQQAGLQRVQSENAQLRAQETKRSAVQDEAGRVRTDAADQAELERLRQWQAKTESELLRLRGMAGLARRANAEAEQLRAAKQASDAATNPVSGAMAAAMKQAMEQQVVGRLSRMTASLHLTPEQTQAARDILMRQAQVMSAGMQQVFSGKYNKDEIARLAKDGGNPEEQIKALLTPEQKSSYQSYQQDEAAHNAGLAANTELLQLQSTLSLTSEQMDRAFAALYDVNLNQLGGGKMPPPFADKTGAMQWLLDQKAKALEPILTPTQLENYHQQQAIQAKLLKDISGKMEGAGDSK